MKNHAKTYTEPIDTTLAEACAELDQHPLLTAAREGELPREILDELAFHQYSDSILWIPMLAQMKAKATRSPRLRKAIEDNIAHEAGLDGTSHVTLAVAMMRSLGLRTLDEFPTGTFGASASLWLGDAFEDFGEPEVAGFLLAAETLVPRMFAAVLPAYARIDCDTRYFVEHVAVDSDAHAAWMREAVQEVVSLYGEESVARVLSGMNDAREETREIPDALWRRACAHASL